MSSRLALAVLLLLPASLAHARQNANAARPPAGSALWLKASAGVDRDLGGLVSRWRDQSGHARNVVQADGSRMPAYARQGLNGRPALQFDGNDFLARASGMPTGDYTKVAVIAIDDYQASNNVLSGATSHALFYGFSDRAQIFHNGTFVTSSVPTPLGQPTILIATYSAGGNAGKLYQDGALVGTGTAAGPNTSATIQVGAYASDNFFRGAIAEVLIYDRVLSDAERASVQSYLAHEYLSGPGFPRVDLSGLPRDGQLVVRDASNQGRVSLGGLVHTHGFDGIVIDVDRDEAPWKSETVPLVYSMAGSAPFAAQVDLEAGLHRYDISVALTSGSSRTVIASAVNVVCGDCYLLNGQSNTVAADYHGENLANQSQSPWIRSFGNAVVSSEVARDLHWNQADGESLNAHGSVGAWGLRMARNLLDAYQVPIALINGAVGGTSITQHLRNDANPTDLDTIYGRMLHRTREAGVAGEARALLWYQGESDGEESDRYQVDFATLHGSWALDYPALEKIYVFQIRKGCGVTFAGVREVLRRLPDSYPEIAVMSTDAAPRHDGCHFFYAGYRELGDRIARLVARDFHGSTDTQNIDPPDVATAQFTSGAHTQIRLTFHDPDDTLVWAAGTEAYLLLNDGTAVVSGAVAGNTILLQLAGPSSATLISLDGHAFDGPWITNSRQVGALSFFDVPILP